MTQALTARQREVLTFIRGHYRTYLRPPTIREIKWYLGCASIYTVTCHLQALERKGAIRIARNSNGRGHARGIVLPEFDRARRATFATVDHETGRPAKVTWRGELRTDKRGVLRLVEESNP